MGMRVTLWICDWTHTSDRPKLRQSPVWRLKIQLSWQLGRQLVRDRQLVSGRQRVSSRQRVSDMQRGKQ